MRLAVPGPRRGPDTGTLPDSALGGLVAEGDGAALAELFARYGGRCYRLAVRVLGTTSGADDVVQEVFVALWRGQASFDPDRGRLESLLLTLTHHKAVDAVRREAARTRRQSAGELSAAVLPDTLTDDPLDRAADVERQQQVREALRRLSEPQREAIVLAYFGGYTQQEIARLTATPVGTVKTRMLAAMQRLRVDLGALSSPAGGAP